MWHYKIYFCVKKILSRQIIFFVIVGVLSAVVEILFFKIFSLFLPKFFYFENNFYGLKFPLSNIFSTIFAIIFNYFLSIWFVFQRGKHNKKKEFTYFFGASLLTMFLNLSFFQFFFNYIFIFNFFNFYFFSLSREMISKIFSIGLVSFLNYVIKKKIIFQS